MPRCLHGTIQMYQFPGLPTSIVTLIQSALIFSDAKKHEIPISTISKQSESDMLFQTSSLFRCKMCSLHAIFTLFQSLFRLISNRIYKCGSENGPSIKDKQRRKSELERCHWYPDCACIHFSGYGCNFECPNCSGYVTCMDSVKGLFERTKVQKSNKR